MKKTAVFLSLMLILANLQSCAETLDLRFSIANESASIDYVSLYPDAFPLDSFLEEGEYDLSVHYNGERGYWSRFDKPVYGISVSAGENSGFYTETSDSVIMLIPWFGKNQSMAITHNGSVLFNGTLQKYLCNENSVCEGFEDWAGCPHDCSAQEQASPPETVLEKFPGLPAGRETADANTTETGATSNKSASATGCHPDCYDEVIDPSPEFCKFGEKISGFPANLCSNISFIIVLALIAIAIIAAVASIPLLFYHLGAKAGRNKALKEMKKEH